MIGQIMRDIGSYWAVRREDSLGPLVEIARAILDREENSNAKMAEGGR